MYFRDFDDAYDWAERELHDLLESMEDYELIDLHRATESYPDICTMEELDAVGKEYPSIYDAVTSDPDFDTSDEWFAILDPDTFVSFSDLDDVAGLVQIDIDGLVSDILRTMDNYDNPEIDAILSDMQHY